MADTKLSAMTELTSPAEEDLVYVVDDPSGTPASRKVTLANLLQVTDPTEIHHRTSTADADDDEYLTDSTGSYTEVDPSTSDISWTHGRHAVTASVTTVNPSNDVSGLVKTGTIAVGESLEVGIRPMWEYSTATVMAGVVMSDGTGDTANIVGTGLYTSNSQVRLRVLSFGGTWTSVTLPSGADVVTATDCVRLRLTRQASTNFEHYLSNDGLTFTKLGISDSTESHTWSHIGLAFSGQSSQTDAKARFEYLRVI